MTDVSGASSRALRVIYKSSVEAAHTTTEKDVLISCMKLADDCAAELSRRGEPFLILDEQPLEGTIH